MKSDNVTVRTAGHTLAFLSCFLIENDIPSRTKSESCATPRGASQKVFAAMAYCTHWPGRTGIQLID